MEQEAVTVANQDMLDMICRPITSELLSHVADQAALVIPCHSNYYYYYNNNNNNNNNKPSMMDNVYGILPSLPSFIRFLVKRSSVRTGTLLGSLVFLQRLQQTLSTIAKGMPCTSHRIFLATLIVTSKTLHDTSPKNKHWAKYAVYFTLSEINLMEKQLLSLMNYHVLISQADLTNAYYRFKQATSLPPSLSFPPKAFLIEPLRPYKQKHPHLLLSAVVPPPPPPMTTNSNEVDIPTYAAQAILLSFSSNLPSLVNDSQNSLSSDDSFMEQEIPPSLLLQPQPAHCRQQGERLKIEDDLIMMSEQSNHVPQHF